MFTINLDLQPMQEIIQRLQPNGAAQYFFSSELMRISDDYVPMNTGVLKNSAYVESDGSAIVYNTPYARYLWYGKLMVDPYTGKGAFYKEGYGFWSRPNTPKVLTERDLEFKGSPRRGSMWVYRAFIDNQQQLQQELTDFIVRGTK